MPAIPSPSAWAREGGFGSMLGSTSPARGQVDRGEGPDSLRKSHVGGRRRGRATRTDLGEIAECVADPPWLVCNAQVRRIKFDGGCGQRILVLRC